MRYSPLRAPARVFAVHSAVILAILGVSTASLPGPLVPYADRVGTVDTALAAQVALADSRIAAPQASEFVFNEVRVNVEGGGLPGQTWTDGVPASVHGNKVLEEAAKYVGAPYVWGGHSPAGFDCVGFVSYVYGNLGVDLPRTTGAYWHIGKRVPKSKARPGDLVVTKGHVAIYAGGNMVVEAPTRGSYVQFRTMWQKNPVFVRVTNDKFWDE